MLAEYRPVDLLHRLGGEVAIGRDDLDGGHAPLGIVLPRGGYVEELFALIVLSVVSLASHGAGLILSDLEGEPVGDGEFLALSVGAPTAVFVVGY